MNAVVFELHPQLAADTHFVRDLELSRVLLMDDMRFAWLILVPMRAGMRDWIDLPHALQHRLLDEVELCSRALRALVKPDKLNIAALGNVVAQLHVHVIARYASDAAWPRPVWNVGERVLFESDALQRRLGTLRAALRIEEPQ